MPNNEVRLNTEDQSAKFNVEYQHYEGASSIGIVHYDINVSKKGDIYTGLIKESDGWATKTTSVQSDNLDVVFNQISDQLDSDDITENTKSKKDAKIAFVKQVYEDSVLNNKKSF